MWILLLKKIKFRNDVFSWSFRMSQLTTHNNLYGGYRTFLSWNLKKEDHFLYGLCVALAPKGLLCFSTSHHYISVWNIWVRELSTGQTLLYCKLILLISSSLRLAADKNDFHKINWFKNVHQERQQNCSELIIIWGQTHPAEPMKHFQYNHKIPNLQRCSTLLNSVYFIIE